MGILGIILAGAAAGSVTGLLGAGGGMVLIPLLTRLTDLREEEIFPASIAIISGICLVCLTAQARPLPWMQALPFLAGSTLGGLAAGLLGNRIPLLWLHRALGIMILWGGWRYLWS